MKKVIKVKSIPAESNIMSGFAPVDYYDMYSVRKITNQPIEEITKGVMKSPDWVDTLFRLRNSIVKVFGLKTPDEEYSKRDIIFTLIEKREDEIIMGENDKHLNFRASILRDKSVNTVSVITIVHFNNVWGKLYFLPVKPFHKLIMKTLLRRYLKEDFK